MTERATPLDFFEAVWMNETLPLHTRLRAATEHAKYVHPRLAAVANISEGSFAAMLDAAIERSSRPLKLIEAKPEPVAEPEGDDNQHSAEELKGPMAKLRRY